MDNSIAAATRSLVNTEDAISFLNLARTDVGGNVFVGDESELDSFVGPEIVKAKIALRNSADKIAALCADETRLAPEKHHLAAKLSHELTDQLERTKTEIINRSDDLAYRAQEMAKIALGPKPERAAIDSEVRQYIKDLVTQPDGMVELRQMIQSDVDIAMVVYSSPSFLMGLTKENHQTLRFNIIEKYVPNSWDMINASIALAKLPKNIDKCVRQIGTSFFNPMVADKYSRTRAQI